MKLFRYLILLFFIPTSVFATDVTVHIEALRNDIGHIIMGVYPNAETFSNPRSAPIYETDIRIVDRQAIIVLSLDPGVYAIALFHDENDDQELETGIGSIPQEGWGFSRDALLLPTWPDYEDASFEVGNAPIDLTINVQYSVIKNFQRAISLDKLNDILPSWPFD